MASRFYKYANIVKNDTSYARRMTRLSNSIFGEITRPTTSKSMKVVKILSIQPHDKNPMYTHWYPRHVETHQLTAKLREYGLYR
ncbi:unnamed protein product [Allacma fusca]|uniref:Small ribosomal subunit protein mS33 n=1 Tax=Allacma fusca TaxID=39272 RepID=A0A8J2J7M2_9HEXA|nr:unnamed protein product [Allacma fusca]